MRLRCPKCNETFTAKANARNVKCPGCGKRETMPPEGWHESPGWRKGKVGEFTRIEEPAARPAATDRRLVVAGAIVGIVVLAGLAWWLLMPQGTSPAAAAQACNDLPNDAPAVHGAVETDLITPGVWNVCGNTDYDYVWVHNNATSALPYTFAVTGPGGAALPDGWSVTFQSASGTLPPQASAQDPKAWAATLATVTIPASQAGADVPAELHAAGATRAFTFHVQAARGAVSKVGDHIDTCYDLKGQDGREIQRGPFPLTVGAQGAVSGYAFGTAGLAPGEKVVLHVPPPFAYGVGGNPPDIHPWETLDWAATSKTASMNCPTGK